jgi:hypothetical protein
MQLGLFRLAQTGSLRLQRQPLPGITADSGLAGSNRSMPKAGVLVWRSAGSLRTQLERIYMAHNFDSSGPLTAAIPASDPAVAGTARITGTNAELTSGSDKA